ncbi:MAG TPA: ImmA/IrrE family metallo-endopeptidase, partial [Stellaceae bacterium]
FTLAHEIAHFILHRDLIEDGVSDDTMYRSKELSGYHEVQANRMAADILMPVMLVKRAAELQSNPDLLARVFRVSPAAMKIRLDGLTKPPR